MLGIDIMKQYLGKHEIKDTEELITLFREESIRGDIWIDPSKNPWCAAMVNACERKAGFKGTGSNLARSFERYGTEVEGGIKNAKYGDILVFKRGNTSWQGHVCYFVKPYTEGFLEVIGGNQTDKVCYQNRTLDGLLAIRRPT